MQFFRKTQIPHRRCRFTRNKLLGNQQSLADVWFSRIASISQAVVVLLTAAGFYFTVLPLYQKALLEEAIAQKETELKSVSTRLEETYGRLRYSAIKQYVFFVGAKCSGLLIRHPPLGQRSSYKKPFAQEVLEIEAHECLLTSLDKHGSLADLRPNDLTQLKERVTNIAAELDKQRTYLLEQYKTKGEGESEVSLEIAKQYMDLVHSKVDSLQKTPWSDAK